MFSKIKYKLPSLNMTIKFIQNSTVFTGNLNKDNKEILSVFLVYSTDDIYL